MSHHWENLPQEFVPFGEGFIYRIDVGGKSYIGKKSFWARTTTAVAGKKRRAKVLKESNWRRYKSSSKEVAKLLKNHMGKFYFLSHCMTKRELTYQETKQLFLHHTLENPDFLNDNILGRFFRGNLA